MSEDFVPPPQSPDEAEVLAAVAELLHDETPERLVRKLMDIRGFEFMSDLYFAAKMYPASLDRFVKGKNKGRLTTTITPLARALNVPVSLFDAWRDESAPERGKQGGRGKESSRPALNRATAYVEAAT